MLRMGSLSDVEGEGRKEGREVEDWFIDNCFLLMYYVL